MLRELRALAAQSGEALPLTEDYYDETRESWDLEGMASDLEIARKAATGAGGGAGGSAAAKAKAKAAARAEEKAAAAKAAKAAARKAAAAKARNPNGHTRRTSASLDCGSQYGGKPSGTT